MLFWVLKDSTAAMNSLSSRNEVAFSSASARCMPLSPSDSVPGSPLWCAMARAEELFSEVGMEVLDGGL